MTARRDLLHVADPTADPAAQVPSDIPTRCPYQVPGSPRGKGDCMRTGYDFDGGGLSVVRRHRHAVVVGGSLAGMLAARVLSDHFDDVTLLERDRFPETPTARKGLPQGRHVHVLLERGRGVMERFLPGLSGELVRAGAETLDATRDVALMSPYGWYVRFPGDLRM